MIALMKPMARAPSVPGRGQMCKSAAFAVRERYASMTTILAPRFCASSTNGLWWRFVGIELHAQMTMYLACTKLSGSTPPVGPTVNSHAVDEPEAQNVFSLTVVPRRLKKGSPELIP